MCHFVSYIMKFQEIIVYKISWEGGGVEAGGGGSIAGPRSIVYVEFKYFLFSLTSNTTYKI